jgi:hypothetical protein
MLLPWTWITKRDEEPWIRDEVCTLVPICVERFMGQADAAVKLAAFQQTVSWQQSQLIAQGGWATAIGSTDPNTAVARACAHQLANRKT